MTNSTFLPATPPVRARRSCRRRKVFRSGMPKEAAGPVAETTTPTFKAP